MRDVGDQGDAGADARPAVSRRSFLGRAAAGGAVAWSAPAILRTSAAAAATVPPVVPFLATGGDGGGRTFRTLDGGLSWPAGGSPVAGGGEVHAVAYSGTANRWIAVGRDTVAGGTAIFTTTDDGASWSTQLPTATGRLLGVATDGAGTWVAVGQTITTYPGADLVLRSVDDGATWVQIALPVVVNQLHAVATDGSGRWVAAGQDNSVKGIVVVSLDNGASWSSPVVLDPTDDAQVIGIATDGAGRWIAGGSFTNHTPAIAALWEATGNNLLTAADWTPNVTIGNGFVYGVASDRSGTFVAVGHREAPSVVPFSYTIQATISAGTFPPGAVYQLHEVATDRLGTWIAVGFDGPGGPMRTYSSSDAGQTWSATASPDPSGILLGVAAKVVE